MTRDEFITRLQKKILVLDGAMGTMIQRQHLSEADFHIGLQSVSRSSVKGCNDVLVLTRPEIIKKIHRDYLDAGADIISTNTFNSNSISLKEYGLSGQASSLCCAGVRLAKDAVDEYCRENEVPCSERPLVAGSMGPTGVSLSIAMQEVGNFQTEFQRMVDAYEEQAAALIEGGTDILLLETAFDLMNAKAAVYGIKSAFKKLGVETALMISATLTEQGRLLSGQTLEQTVESLAHSGAVSIGLNCGFGASALIPYVKNLSEIVPVSVSTHPNAGLPDALGNYTDNPQKMCDEVREIMRQGCVNIIGGCCGTTPEHIHLIVREAKKWKPREITHALVDKHFIKIGERCNVAGSRKFLRLIGEGNYRECLDIAADQIEKGADILDINMDDAMLDTRMQMSTFLTMLASDPRAQSTPVMIDSSDFNVIRAGMRLLPLHGVVNSISLKNGEEEFLARASEIHAMGCSMVVMAFDEKGQADTFERRIEICSRAYNLLTKKAVVPASEIIFDPNVLAIATGIEAHRRYALDFLEATEWIKQNLPGARVSGGISNLSFSFRGIDPVRKAMHSIFLEHAIERGMDMAIINPNTPLDSAWVDPELHELIDDVLLMRRVDADERLVNYAVKLKQQLDEAKKNKVRDPKVIAEGKDTMDMKTSCERLSDMLVTGNMSGLEQTLDEALAESGGSAMTVVNKALMAGMNRVGELFGEGKMFLPQVVRCASVMKKAVEYLTPVIEKEQVGSSQNELSARQLVVLATVKGDVHDIGKNIVATVLRCAGYEVEDLGVMTPAEKIIETAVAKNAVAIGLSGLITPSLHEMGVVAEMMEQKGMTIPLFVGGATTSDVHAAVKLAPRYSGPVVRTGEAASLPGVLARFVDPGTQDEMFEALRSDQQLLMREYMSAVPQISLEDARNRSMKVVEEVIEPILPGEHEIEISIAEASPRINWRAMLKEWNLDPQDMESEEAKKLLFDARMLLMDIKGTIKAKVFLLSCHSEGDDIVVEYAGGKFLRLPTLRSCTPNPVTGICLAVSDFIRSEGDYIGLFAVTVAGSGIEERIEELSKEDEYRSLLLQSLSHRLVEAATDRMHRHVRKYMWGIGIRQGIRPAIGYPSLPDQSLVKELDKIIDYKGMGITVTERGALSPSATTTGLILAHPQSRYFEVGRISDEMLEDYAERRGMKKEIVREFLP